MKIFSGSSNKPLAEKVAAAVNVSLSPVEIFIFPDGERRIQIQDRVVDEDTIVIQSTNSPVDTHYMELFFIMDGLRRSGARSVAVVMPYLGYQRQDHIFRDGEAVSIDVIVKSLEALHLNKILFFDPHTIKLPEFFKVPVLSLSALPLFVKKIKEKNLGTVDSVLVSPDMGGLRRIEQMSELLDGMSWIATVKNRDLSTGSIEIESFTGPLPISELKGKRALIVDDMISSGKTIVECARLLKMHGVTECHVFVTHPIFSAEAPELLQNSAVSSVYVTDSVYVPDDKKFAKLEILTISDMIASKLQLNP